LPQQRHPGAGPVLGGDVHDRRIVLQSICQPMESQLAIQTGKLVIKWGPVPPRFIWPRFGLVQRAAVAFDAAHKKCPNKLRPSQLIRAIWTRFSPRQFRFWLLTPFAPETFYLRFVGVPKCCFGLSPLLLSLYCFV